MGLPRGVSIKAIRVGTLWHHQVCWWVTLILEPPCFSMDPVSWLLADLCPGSLPFGPKKMNSKFLVPFWIKYFFSRMHATLQPALSVSWLVGWSVGRSVTLSFFASFWSLRVVWNYFESFFVVFGHFWLLLVIFGHFWSFSSLCSFTSFVSFLGI